MESTRGREFTWIEGLAFCVAAIATQLSSEVINQWGTYFYSPSEGVGRTIYVAIGAVGWIFLAGTIWDAITDPLIGALSDRTPSLPRALFRKLRPTGRRRPYIFWGSIGMTFTSIAFWFPPVDEASPLNLAYGTVLLCLHWTMFTVTVVPLISLMPEVARSERARVAVGTWNAVGMILGLALAAVLPGVLIDVLDTARAEGVYSAQGYRTVAIIFAFISLVLFQMPVWCIRERYDSAAAGKPPSFFLAGLGDACRNRYFITYAIAFLFFTTGFLAAQRVLPYWAELGLGGNEGTVTVLLLPFIVCALASYAVIPIAARYLRVKWMLFLAFLILATGMPWMYFIGIAEYGFQTKCILGGALFAYCGIGQGILYVMMTPAMGEVIDHDELALSGERREALYNGLSGFIWKASMGGSIIIATQSMNFWGNSPEQFTGVLMVGPIAGLFGLLGMGLMLFYPSHPPTAPGQES